MLNGTVRFVEDEESSYWLLETALKSLNVAYVGHRSAEDLLNQIDSNTSLVFMDVSLPGLGGLDCVRTLKRNNPSLPVVMVSACEKQESITKALTAGAIWYVVKPLNIPDIRCAIETALLVKNQQKLTKLAVSAFADQEIPKSIEKIAQSSCSVLIDGEHGTGKTTLARRVHDLSPRRDFAFIPVSCANIPRELFEAELFGYEKGAFTGATSSRQGLVELADKGTLFLDEIGDLPLDLQPKLLTFLQERHASRLGSRFGKNIDTRVLAATNQDINALVNRGLFRADLLYRLNVIRLTVPPLRNRISDLPGLIEVLTNRICDRNALSKKLLSREAMARLCEYSFPGNVRELENILEHAMVLSENDIISAGDLSLNSGQLERKENPYDGKQQSQTLAELEKVAIKSALNRCGGSRAMAARELGITERTIYNKLRLNSLE